jgi:hypothetical protein
MTYPKSIYSTISALAIGVLFVFSTYVLSLPESQRIPYAPDDTFYYLSIAQHLPWASSFDGITSTTGYQPLWGFILALVPGGLAGAITLCFVMSVLALVLVWTTLESPAQHLALTLIVGSTGVMLSTVSGMESGLLMFLLAVGWVALRSGRTRAVGVLAALCVLARPEAALLVVVAWYYTRHRSLLVGGAIGLFSLVGWNLLVSGGVASSSAAMKAHWSHFYDPVGLFRRGMGQLASLVMGVSAGGLYVVAALVGVVGSRRWVAGAVMLALVVALGMLEWVQTWHVIAIAPLFLFGLSQMFDVRGRWLPVIGGVVVAVVALNVTTLFSSPPYPINALNLRAARSLPLGMYGSFNAGVVGYYSRGMVFNLDGLVNDEVHPYITGDSLARYLDYRQITHIIDNDSTILSAIYKWRGGYSDGLPLRPVFTFGQTREFGNVRLWEVVR